MSDLEAIADRIEIEALRGEFTDAAMMRDYARLASLFTPEGELQILDAGIALAGQREIRSWGERVPDVVTFFIQNTHPGIIRLEVRRARLRGQVPRHHPAGRRRAWPRSVITDIGITRGYHRT